MFRQAMQVLVHRKAAALVLFLCFGSAQPAQADTHLASISPPTNPVALSLKGKIQNTNIYGQADFDMAMLQALPPTRIATTTPWTSGTTTFEGVLVKTLFNHVAAKGDVGEFGALNDYTVRIALKDLIQYNAIIAYHMNGKPMSVRDKGPLWLVFPIDDNPILRTAFYTDRMIWQLRTIDIK